jgi:hypothetical protein
MPPNWNPYIPWYFTMPSVMIIVGNLYGGKKLLNYLEYIKNLDPYTHVHVFKQAIKVNNVTHEGTKIAYVLMDVARHGFDLGGQLCEQPPRLYLQ